MKKMASPSHLPLREEEQMKQLQQETSSKIIFWRLNDFYLGKIEFTYFKFTLKW